MSRWNPDESLERPWQMLREMRGSGDGYRISGANPKGESIGIYCSRADLDLIIEAVNAYETLRAENARYREALEFYADPKHWEDHNVICTYDVIQEDDRSIPDECCDYRGGRRAREALKGSE